MFKNKVKLFAISLLAVWLVLFFKNVDIPLYFGSDWQFVGLRKLLNYRNAISFSSLAMIVYALLSLIQLHHRTKGSPDSLKAKMSEVTNMNYYYINTLATIITVFSVIFIPIDIFRDFLVFVVIMTVITVCFLRTNLYYSNPLLALLGYNIYTVKSYNSKIPDDSIAIFHGKLDTDTPVYYYHIADNVYYLV